MKKSGSLFSGFPGIFQTGGGELLCRFLCPPYGLSEVSEASSGLGPGDFLFNEFPRQFPDLVLHIL